MQQKKPTNAQLQKRIANALIHIDKTKDTKSIFFCDKGLRLIVDNDYAIIETGYHRHVFNDFTAAGVSRSWLYTKRIIEIANANDCNTDNGYSFAKLLETLKEKEDKSEYNIVVYFDWWLFNIFQPLFSIGETEAESFLVYEAFLHNVARNAILLEERNEDLTNKQFIDGVIKNIKEFTDGLEERIIMPKKTDEQMIQENIEAIREQENEQAVEAQINGTE
jgi:hypothetical protein